MKEQKRLNVNIDSSKYFQLKMRAFYNEITISDLVKIWVDNYLESDSINANRAD